MKILELKIFKNNSLVKELKFKEKGVNYIFGDIEKKDDSNETSNSLGKTIILKFLDYIMGCSPKEELQRKAYFKDVYIIGRIKIKDVVYSVKRFLNSPKVFINNEDVSQNEELSYRKYNEKMQFNRKILTEFILLKNKTNFLGSNDNNKNITGDTINLFLETIKWNELLEKTLEFSELLDQHKINNTIFKNEIKQLKISQKNLKNTADAMEEENNLLNEEINQLENNLKNLNFRADLKKYEISLFDLIENEKYYENSMYLLEGRKKNIEEYIKDYSNFNITKKEIERIVSRTSFELPSLNDILNKIEVVEEFHKKVLIERNESLKNELDLISQKLNLITKNLELIKKDIYKKRQVLQDNNSYKNSLNLLIYKKNLYSENTNNLREYKKLLDLKNDIRSAESKLEMIKSETYEILFSEKYIKKLKMINLKIKEMLELLYGEKKVSAFTIEPNDVKSRSKKILDIEFTIKGDTGEGIEAVKYNLIDYIKVIYSRPNIFIQDSSCFSGTDNRQTRKIIVDLMGKISSEQDIQIFVAINKFQLIVEDQKSENDEVINGVKKNAIIVLSEINKLFGEDF